MKILFLHEVDYRMKPIYEMHEFPEALSNLGHEVAFFDYAEMSKQGRLLEVKLEAGRVLEEERIRIFSQRSFPKGLVGRLVAVVLFPTLFVKALRNFKPDVVVSYSVPTSGWQALILCKIFRIPFLFRALDVSHKIRRTIFELPIRGVERFIYTHADWISANNPAMAEYCVTHGGVWGQTSVDFPPLDLEHFSPSLAAIRKQKKKLGIPDKARVYLYMGSFFYFSGLDAVIKSFSSLRRENDILVLVGGGEQQRSLEKLAKDLGVKEHVIFPGFIDFFALPATLGTADVSLNPMEVSLVSNTALPNKVLQYMAVGRPVVSTKLEGLSKTFGKGSADLLLVDDPESVFEAAQIFLDEKHKLGNLSPNRSEVALRFDSQVAVKMFENRLKELSTKHD